MTSPAPLTAAEIKDMRRSSAILDAYWPRIAATIAERDACIAELRGLVLECVGDPTTALDSTWFARAHKALGTPKP